MSKKALPIIALGGLAAVGAAVALTGEAKAKTPPKRQRRLPPGVQPPTPPAPPPGKIPVPKPTEPPAELVGRILAAVASRDPAKMRALATEVRRLGFPQQAQDLENAALAIERERARTRSPGLPPVTIQPVGPGVPVKPPKRKKRPKKRTPRVKKPAPVPVETPPVVVRPPKKRVPLPPEPPRVTPPEPPPPPPPPPVAKKPIPPPPPLNPRKALAVQVAEMLAASTKGTENKAMIKAYQAQEGLKPSGFYGPGTGKSFIKYDIIPPKPFYWPRRSTAASKNDYRKNLLFQATKDPARATEWQQAAMVF